MGTVNTPWQPEGPLRFDTCGLLMAISLVLLRVARSRFPWAIANRRPWAGGAWVQPRAHSGLALTRQIERTTLHALPCHFMSPFTHTPPHIDGRVFLLHAGRCVPACQPAPPAPTWSIHAYQKRLCTNPSGASSAWHLRPRHSSGRYRPHTPLHICHSLPAARFALPKATFRHGAPISHENDTRKATPALITPPLDACCSSNIFISGYCYCCCRRRRH
jgi:hypothetical protein